MKNHSLKASILAICLSSGVAFANTCATPANGQYVPQTNQTCFYSDTSFTTTDGLTMLTNLFLPKAVAGQKKYPVIVLTTSWGTPKFEYLGASQALANKGYIVSTVLSRGFFRAQGLANPADDLTVADTSTQINWLLARTPADVNKVGLAGISLGAGVSMMAANVDPRVKAVASLSGWSDLKQSMLPNGATNAAGIDLLLNVGNLTARMSPDLPMLANVMKDPHLNTATINNVISPWAKTRSPILNLDGVNARQTAVLLQNNFQDELFNPTAAIGLYNALKGSKRLELFQGGHALPGAPWALTGYENGLEPVYRWFDRFLKGENNGVDTELPVGMRTANTTISDRYASVPTTGLTYFLKGRQNSFLPVNFGALQAKSSLGVQQNSFQTTQETPAKKSDVTVGLGFIQDKFGMVYQTDLFKADTALRGIPKVKLFVTPNTSTLHLVAYLYELDPMFNVGKFITHAPLTLRDLTPDQTIPVDLDFFAMAYNVKKGKRLALVIDGQDATYTRPAAASTVVKINTGGQYPSSLLLPVGRY